MPANILIRRKYLETLVNLLDDPRVKAILGPAFVGKSVLLNQLKGELIARKIPETMIATLSYDRAVIQVKEKFNEELETACAGNPRVLLIDSIHAIPNYREVIQKFHQTHPEISIYVTVSTNSIWEQKDVPGSSDNVVNIHLYPLTFREFLQRYPGNPQVQFDTFLRTGGFPFITPDLDESDTSLILDGFMHLVAMRLILRENKTNPRGMATLLTYLFANVSNCLTMKEILANTGVVDNRTLEKYIQHILDSGIMFLSNGYQMDRGMKESAKMVFFAVDTLNGSFINLRGLQRTPKRNAIANILYVDLKVRGYEPEFLLYKGEPAGLRIFIGDKPLMLRVDLKAEETRKMDAFTAFRVTTMDKVLLTTDITTPELKRCHQMNLVDFLMKDDLSDLVSSSDPSNSDVC